MSLQRLNIGDTVSWSSQAQGTTLHKVGVVVVVVPPGTEVQDALRDVDTSGYKRLGGPGFARDRESYVVGVPPRAGSASLGTLYWPRLGALVLKSTVKKAPSSRPLVIIESRYAGDIERNVAYLREALRDSLMRGEAPFASHAIYTQEGVLDDLDPAERMIGIEAGLLWGALTEKTVVYADHGISIGMQYGIDRANAEGRAVEYRFLRAKAEAI